MFARVARRLRGKQPEPETREPSRSRSRSRSGGSGGGKAWKLRHSDVGCKRRQSGAALRRRSSAACAQARRSFAHHDFANPEAQTCWLSCLFQSLWHSSVFHKAFEQELVAAKYTPTLDERLLAALQRTWAEYEAAAAAVRTAELVAEPGFKEASCIVGAIERQLVPPEALAVGFGRGYGDISEALACLQKEMDESSNPLVAGCAALLALLPVSIAEGGEELDDEAAFEDWPTPGRAWELAVDWQVASRPIIAVDIVLPFELEAAECEHVARLWVEGEMGHAHSHEQGESKTRSHRLVALVCFMYNYEHYVAFCRRQCDSSRCIFFNDLPHLLPESTRELAWTDVPTACSRNGLVPRLALYESQQQ